jgi:predicted transposase YbfD/YdcC
VSAPSSSPIAGVLDQLKAVADEGTRTDATPECLLGSVGGLRERLAVVPDPRRAAGRRHSLLSILLITICALAADKNVFTHIEAWARDAPPVVLSAMDVRFDALSGRHVPPDESTIRDVLARIDAPALAKATAGHLADLAVKHPDSPPAAPIDEREARRARSRAAEPAAALPALAADGKRLAGARRPDGTHVHLLSLVDHATGTTFAQHEITAKTNEIPELAVLLADTDLAGATLTVDALHTQRKTARMIAEDHYGFYLMTVKANQPTLHDAIAARFGAPNSDFAAEGRYHLAENRGHGRVEQRQIRTADAEGIDFPYAAQIAHITRRTRKLDTEHGWNHKEHVYAITNLPAHLAGPADLAAAARGHWSIENSSHHVRDTTFAEDAHQARTANTPANLASLRNLVTGVFRAAGHANIAHARSLHANRYERALTLFDL